MAFRGATIQPTSVDLQFENFLTGAGVISKGLPIWVALPRMGTLSREKDHCLDLAVQPISINFVI